MMKCKVCGSSSSEIFSAKILGKYQVSYYQCEDCQFIQTETPYWLEEAYSSAITALDIGLLSRNLLLQEIVPKVIDELCNPKGKFVDYGGGYGVLVRLLRDKGYDFYRQDNYCQNLFANGFDVEDYDGESYELLTAFEVFEHLVDPVSEVEKMLQYASDIFFSTELVPTERQVNPENWWYVAPEIGQHVALYSRESLERLAARFQLKYFNYSNYHLFTKKNLSDTALRKIIIGKKILERVALKLYRPQQKSSLLKSDFDGILKNLRNEDIH